MVRALQVAQAGLRRGGLGGEMTCMKKAPHHAHAHARAHTRACFRGLDVARSDGARRMYAIASEVR